MDKKEIEFKQVTAQNIHEITPHLMKIDSQFCDFTPLALLMWADYFNNSFAFFEGKLVLRSTNSQGRVSYSMPQDAAALQALRQYALGMHGKLILFPLNQNEVQQLVAMGAAIEDGGWGDYIYSAESLIKLEGKKYHGQRNHIKNFIRTNRQWSVEEIGQQNLPQIIDFMHSIADNSTPHKEYEQKKVVELLRDYHHFKQLGLALRGSDGEIAGFAVGEVKGNVCFMHIEKASRSIKGAYPMIDNQFIKYAVELYPHVSIINKEEDMGDAGLKKAKESYHPLKKLDKKQAVLI